MDKKDLQLLEMLTQDCRLSHTTLAQALRVSKDTVAYRIKRLEDEGTITQNMLFIDGRRLGFTRYHLLLRLKAGSDKDSVAKIISDQAYVMWVNSFIGRYDLQVILDAKDSFHLDSIREKLFVAIEHAVKDYSLLTHLWDYEFTQHLPVFTGKMQYNKKNDHSFSLSLAKKNFPVSKEFEVIKPRKVDIDIMKLLADDATMGLSKISRTLHIDRQTVKQRITKLISQKILLNFGSIPSKSKLGYVVYYLLVRFTQDTSETIKKSPFRELTNIFYAGNMLGDYDMILYLNAKSPQELNESIELFKKKIGSNMLHYDLLVQDKLFHWRQFTDGMYGELLK